MIFQVVPQPEVLYQAADPKQAHKTRALRRRALVLFLPAWSLVASIRFIVQDGSSGPDAAVASIALLAVLVAFSAFVASMSRAITHPNPPAITTVGVLVYPWTPFGGRTPVEHRFEDQQTVKGYRAGEYTVIEFYPPNGKQTKITVFDPEERALALVRQTVLKFGTTMA